MTPVDKVRERYRFPFDLRPYQIDEVNQLCRFERAGYYWEPGSGKTAGSTHQMLYDMLERDVGRYVLVVPPILLEQWQRWLQKIVDLDTGKKLEATIYQGTPKQREATPLTSKFTLMSMGIFKNDFEKLHDAFHGDDKVGTNVDEATSIKNYESDNHRAVHLFSEDLPLLALTGTPLNKPGDAYGYIRLIAPGLYRNHRQFERLHVEAFDEYDKATEWCNLDLLAQNMKVQTSRVLRREVAKDLPDVIYTPITYRLAPAHLKFYRRIAEERLLSMESGGEINAISASKLRSQLQQVILNWGHFAEDDSLVPTGFELIDEVMEEIGDRKLVVVANFRLSNAQIMAKTREKYGTVAVYGDVTPKGKSEAVSRFIDDPSCRLITLQPDSAGFGVDGLQHVCSDMLILEAPTTPTPFTQVVARLDRDGQKEAVNCRVAIARGTVQVRMFGDLLNKDALANSVQGSYLDLKEAIFGDE